MKKEQKLIIVESIINKIKEINENDKYRMSYHNNYVIIDNITFNDSDYFFEKNIKDFFKKTKKNIKSIKIDSVKWGRGNYGKWQGCTQYIIF